MSSKTTTKRSKDTKGTISYNLSNLRKTVRNILGMNKGKSVYRGDIEKYTHKDIPVETITNTKTKELKKIQERNEKEKREKEEREKEEKKREEKEEKERREKEEKRIKEEKEEEERREKERKNDEKIDEIEEKINENGNKLDIVNIHVNANDSNEEIAKKIKAKEQEITDKEKLYEENNDKYNDIKDKISEFLNTYETDFEINEIEKPNKLNDLIKKNESLENILKTLQYENASKKQQGVIKFELEELRKNSKKPNYNGGKKRKTRKVRKNKRK